MNNDKIKRNYILNETNYIKTKKTLRTNTQHHLELI